MPKKQFPPDEILPTQNSDSDASKTFKPTLDLGQTNHRRGLRFGLLLTGLVIATGGLVGLFRYQQTGSFSLKNGAEEGRPSITAVPEDEAKIPAQLDGRLVSAKLATRRPLAIMIENYPNARPQSGLGSASAVYEAVTEGGITRFMAVFGPTIPTKVGPVRSARTYYLDWALEYDAGYAHVGGNIDALDLIPELGIKNLDQFVLGTKAYQRFPQAGKATEHTMYAYPEKLLAIADSLFGTEQKWTGPKFKTPFAKEHRPTSQTITINFSSPTYQVVWSYDPETNSYLRSLAGSLHKDALTGEAVRADNIFIQEVKAEPTLTRINETGLTMTTVGSGKAQVFQDGKRIEATWNKTSRSAPTIFSDLSGTEIQRNPGTSWFEIVQPAMDVTVAAPTI